MTERQQTIWKWAGRVLILLAGMCGILAAADYLPTMVQRYAALATALLGFAARWAEQQLPAVKGPKGPPLTILLIMGACLCFAAAGCPGKLAPGYRALTVAVKVTNEGGKTLAGVCKAKRMSCVDKLGTEDKAALRECLGKCPEALKHWVRIVKPAVGTGVEVTFQSLEQARAGKDADWLSSLKGWGCTLIRAVTLCRDILGDKAQTYLNLLTSVEGWVCK